MILSLAAAHSFGLMRGAADVMLSLDATYSFGLMRGAASMILSLDATHSFGFMRHNPFSGCDAFSSD